MRESWLLRSIPIIRCVGSAVAIGLGVALAVGSPAEVAGAAATNGEPDVLIVDFIGLNDDLSTSKHPDQFRDLVLPGADLVKVGIHDIVPDSKRAGSGYDLIVPADAERHYDASAKLVADRVKGPRAVVAFDFNEAGLMPQQIRNALLNSYPASKLLTRLFSGKKWGTPEPILGKIHGPAMVAAKSVELWLNQHPRGRVVLRGHSDGTWAALYIIDYLRTRGLHPDAVVLESPRQVLGKWLARAKKMPGTTFIGVNANFDLAREGIMDEGWAKTTLPNVVNYNLTSAPPGSVSWWDKLSPFKAHSSVTQYDTVFTVQRHGIDGYRRIDDRTLGSLIAAEVGAVLARYGSPRGYSTRDGIALPTPQSSAHEDAEQRRKLYAPSAVSVPLPPCSKPACGAGAPIGGSGHRCPGPNCPDDSASQPQFPARSGRDLHDARPGPGQRAGTQRGGVSADVPVGSHDFGRP